jgi:hypothetical protein
LARFRKQRARERGDFQMLRLKRHCRGDGGNVGEAFDETRKE